MAHAMRMESLGVKTRHRGLGMFQALVQDIPDSKASKGHSPAVLEDPTFRPAVNLQFHAETAQELYGLRPDETTALFSPFSHKVQLKGLDELQIRSS